MKVLLVDDEIFTIRMMQNVISWRDMGLEIMGYAQSGEEAYEKVLREKPDIIISDIRMSGMSGIELLKKVHTYDAGIRVILVSAYADFSYAREALKAGCSDYILKPVDEMELEHSLRRVTAEIQGEKEQEKKFSKNEEQLFAMKLYQYMKSGKGKNKLMNFTGGFQMEGFRVFLVRLDSSTIDEFDNSYNIEMGNEKYIRNILEQTSEENGGKSYIFDYEEECWTVIWQSGGEEKPQEFAERIIVRLREELDISVNVNFSSEGETLEELPGLYQEVLNLGKYSFYVGDEKIFGYGYNCSKKEMERIRNIGSFRDISQAVSSGDRDTMISVINEIIQNAGRSDEAGIQYAKECGSHMISEIKKLGKKETEYDLRQAEKEAEEADSLKQIKECMLELTEAIPEKKEAKKTSYSRPVQESIQFIEENYRENLSLEEICNRVSVSKNYFCYLFKREMGISLWNYLTEVRLRHAKDLLKNTDMKSYEIAFSVGYENPSYFSKIFKRYEQMTPNEYRDTLLS